MVVFFHSFVWCEIDQQGIADPELYFGPFLIVGPLLLEYGSHCLVLPYNFEIVPNKIPDESLLETSEFDSIVVESDSRAPHLLEMQVLWVATYDILDFKLDWMFEVFVQGPLEQVLYRREVLVGPLFDNRVELQRREQAETEASQVGEV